MPNETAGPMVAHDLDRFLGAPEGSFAQAPRTIELMRLASEGG